MENSDHVVDQIAELKSALLRYPSPQVQGAKLNQYMQSVVPDLDFREMVGNPGPGALKKFVLTYLADTLTHVGYNGGDVVYEISGHLGELPSHVDPNIWKTFVSPSSSQNVIVSADRSKILRKNTDDLGPDELIVSNVTIPEHDRLRDEFIESLEPEIADTLREKTKEGVEYGEWLGLLRERGLSKRWGEFRKNGLIENFHEKLTALNLDSDTVEVLGRQLAASQTSTKVLKDPPRPSFGPTFVGGHGSTSKAQPRPSGENKVEFGRRLAHSAVDAMSYDELRSIRLSLGAVLDALNER